MKGVGDMENVNLKNLRKERGLSLADVASGAGITEVGYMYYEYGKRTPNVRTAIRIAGVLGVQSWNSFCKLWENPLT